MLFIYFGALGLAVSLFSGEMRRLVCLRNGEPVIWGEFLDAGNMFPIAAFAWWRLRKTVLVKATQQRLLRWRISSLVVIVWAVVAAVLGLYLIQQVPTDQILHLGLEWVLLIVLSLYAILVVLAVVFRNWVMRV